MRNLRITIACFLWLIFGFLLSEVCKRKVEMVYPVENVDSGLHGVMITSRSVYLPLFLRQTTSIIGNEDWKMFCPLKHVEKT